MLVRRIIGLTAIVFLAATTANAAEYSMTGEWFLNRGGLVDIPQNGGPEFCFGGEGAPGGCAGGSPAAQFRPADGGVPAAVQVAVTGTGVAAFTIPKSAFQQGYRTARSTNPVTFAPTVVQLSTLFKATGPIAKGTFSKSHFAGSAPRVAAAFSWCPGKPLSCAAPAEGTLPLRVKYSGGANAFGGTMSLIFQGTGSIVVRKTVVAPSGPVQIFKLGGGTGPPGSQAPGRGYADFDTDMLQAGTSFASYMVAVPCTGPLAGGATPPGCGVVTAIGASTGMAGIPDTNSNWGFPWTTGMVTAINTGTLALQPTTTTIIGTGSDMRNSIGAGNITMVAGGVSNRTISGAHFTAFDIVTMKFVAPVPALSPTGLAIGVTMLVLAAGFAFRKRF